jgi:hypothetical protein
MTRKKRTPRFHSTVCHTPPESPAGDSPQFVSAEIGIVNGSTVAVTFDAECVTPPVVVIRENGTITTSDGGTIQGDVHIVYYVIPIPWHGSDSVITVDGHAVTNNITWLALQDLQGDTLAESDSDPVGLWEDQTIYGNDAIASGTARPLKITIEGQPAAKFDADDDVMDCGVFGDNPTSIGHVCIWSVYSPSSGSEAIIGKYDYNGSSTKWLFNTNSNDFQQYDGEDLVASLVNTNSTFDESIQLNHLYITADVMQSYTDADLFIDGDNSLTAAPVVFGTMTSLANNEHVFLGAYAFLQVTASIIVMPAPSVVDLAALNQRLADRYGVTLP